MAANYECYVQNENAKYKSPSHNTATTPLKCYVKDQLDIKVFKYNHCINQKSIIYL